MRWARSSSRSSCGQTRCSGATGTGDRRRGRTAVTARSLGVILNDVRVQIALATLAVSQFVMISTTSTSPLYLHDQGHNVQTIGLAVSLHLAGMYVAVARSRAGSADRFGRSSSSAAGR
jgi:hypothetical protein